MNVHLTEEQIDDQLLGDLAPDAAAHLAGCALCQAALAQAMAPVASFREVSLEWAERRSATLPSPAAASAGNASARRFALGSLSAVTAAAVVIALVIPVVHHNRTPQVGMATASGSAMQANATSTADEDAQIARDNQMLAAIDDALNAPVRPAGLTNRSHSRTNPLRD